MSKELEIIATKKAPAAIGPYSQAVVAGDFVYLSGQIPINPETGELVEGDVSAQADQVCRNIGEVLKEAGCGYENVVKTTCFLADLKDFAAFNEVYGRYFTGKPARSCVAVREIPKSVLCEVEVIAYRG
ncbi:MAG: RidA family protein [Eubacteriales bacterium]|nr:RidA family protein [Eubacteriales bacterium]